jgi:hypothetical protein
MSVLFRENEAIVQMAEALGGAWTSDCGGDGAGREAGAEGDPGGLEWPQMLHF